MHCPKKPEAVMLMEFIQALGLDYHVSIHETYQHIGATLADAILQAGLSYRAVVEPRVRRIRCCFPEAVTTSGACQLIECIGVHDFLNWCHPVKPMRLMRLLNLFATDGVETELQLKAWLGQESNCRTLSDVDGVGPKTIDYLKILVGHDTIAVDRHIRTFVREAGLTLDTYEEVQSVVSEAAELLATTSTSLDHAIWIYVSSRPATKKDTARAGRQGHRTLGEGGH